MTKEKVIAHAKRYSKSYTQTNGPWNVEFDSMAMKTALKALLNKWGYLSVELANAITEDEDMDTAERVGSEIRNNANTQTMGFTPAEVVGSQMNGASGTGYNTGNFNQPTF